MQGPGAVSLTGGFPKRWLPLSPSVSSQRDYAQGRGRCFSGLFLAPGSVLCWFGIFPASTCLILSPLQLPTPFRLPSPAFLSVKRGPVSDTTRCSGCWGCGRDHSSSVFRAPLPVLSALASWAVCLPERLPDTLSVELCLGTAGCAYSCGPGFSFQPVRGSRPCRLVTATTPCFFCTG